jgi:hypothetical protein
LVDSVPQCRAGAACCRGHQQQCEFSCSSPHAIVRSLAAESHFPPAACWCARMIVPSMMPDSKSGSSAAIMRSHTPALAQRRKRFHTLFHLPKNGERPRHGLPVRAIHTIASTNRRLSFPERPGSPGLPGIKCSIRPHCSSVNLANHSRLSPFGSLESQPRFRGTPLNVHTT